MIDKNSSIIRRVLGIFTALSVVIAGICLISACLSIYFGSGEYTRELVKTTFKPIAAAVLICPLLALIGFVSELFLPAFTEEKSNADTLAPLLKRLTATKCADSRVQKERTKRRTAKAVVLSLMLAAAAVFFIYALNARNYSLEDINGSVIRAVYLLIPCLVLCFSSAIIVEILNEKSIKREIELLKAAEKKESAEAEKAKKSIAPAIRFTVLIIALALLVYGYVIGGTADVLTKAVNICTECIGLG